MRFISLTAFFVFTAVALVVAAMFAFVGPATAGEYKFDGELAAEKG